MSCVLPKYKKGSGTEDARLHLRFSHIWIPAQDFNNVVFSESATRILPPFKSLCLRFFVFSCQELTYGEPFFLIGSKLLLR